MKKLFLVALVALLSVSINAQVTDESNTSIQRIVKQDADVSDTIMQKALKRETSETIVNIYTINGICVSDSYTLNNLPNGFYILVTDKRTYIIKIK